MNTDRKLCVSLSVCIYAVACYSVGVNMAQEKYLRR
jgi:hypothetical protein